MNPVARRKRHWWQRGREYRSRLRGWLLEDRANVGLGGPPNNWAHTDIAMTETWGFQPDNIAANFDNDAGELHVRSWWTGQPDSLNMSFDVRAFRRLALWFLWRWAWGEWFGLRRRLFYWDLHRRMKPYLRRVA